MSGGAAITQKHHQNENCWKIITAISLSKSCGREIGAADFGGLPAFFKTYQVHANVCATGKMKRNTQLHGCARAFARRWTYQQT